MVDNWDWIGKLNLINLLQDVGSQLTINQMLAKESVKLRLAKTAPMTFMEFNYQILQAYDFVHLNKTYECSIQMGGSDQWGNIIAGLDLCRKVNTSSVHAITCPLVARSDGQNKDKALHDTSPIQSPEPYHKTPFSHSHRMIATLVWKVEMGFVVEGIILS